MTLPTPLASAMSQIDSALRYIPAPNKGEVSGPLVNAKKCMESAKNSLENYVESLQFEQNASRTNETGKSPQTAIGVAAATSKNATKEELR